MDNGNNRLALFSLEDVVIGYEQTPLIQQITGTLFQGDMVAIVGDNGRGKSTLLKTLMGETPCLGGRLEYCASLKKQKIGYLSQLYSASRDFPLTVFELVAMGAWGSLGLFQALSGGVRKKVSDALEQVGLSDYQNHLVQTLSGGQFQRALFARLIVQDPSLIFLDEPFNALDEATRLDLQELVLEWHEQGRTLMVVLHDWDFVEAAFPQVLYLGQGRMIGWGKTEDVLPPRTAVTERRA